MSNKLKICVYAISKNEEQFVERFYESCKDADLVLLADTGSTDNTVKVAKDCGIEVHEISVTPWRFDLARNVSICLIPKDIDVCVSIDLDEVLTPGWREEIERLWVKGKTTRMRYMYDWGNNMVFYYEKIHARHGYLWVNMCHEVVAADPRQVDDWVYTDKLMVVHKPDPTKSRGQYLSLLEADIKENPQNVRNTFYYGRELSFNRKWQEAIDVCQRYLNMPEATWDDERCYALRVQGKCYDEMGKGEEALKKFRLACMEAPHSREPWVELATSCCAKRLWNECYFAATQALAITEKRWVYTADPSVWGPKTHDLAALSAFYLGLKDKALEHGAKALELDPTNERLKNNMKYYRGEV
jgi:tetratricopeptide (TPR) repeat protein